MFPLKIGSFWLNKCYVLQFTELLQEYRSFTSFRKKATITTMVSTCYDHPRYPKLKLWDVLRIETITQRFATYWEKMELDKCDAYLIFANGRFTENDGALADKVHSVGKTFFFIRTKIDLDLRNATHDQGLASFTDEQEHKELLRIRKYYLINLKGVESNLEDVYLIHNKQ